MQKRRPKWLRFKASTADEVFEALRVWHAEAESMIGVLITENEEMKKEVRLCKAHINAITKQVENFDNLQKIVSSALEVANKEKVELKALVDELTLEIVNFKATAE